MSRYEFEPINQDLKADIAEFKRCVEITKNENGAIYNSAFALFFFGKSADLGIKTIKINIPYGLDDSTFGQKICTELKSSLFSRCGLQLWFSPKWYENGKGILTIATPTAIIGAISLRLGSHDVFMSVTGRPALLDDISTIVTEQFPPVEKFTVERLRLRRGFITSEQEVLPPPSQLAHSEVLYPYLSESTPARLWDLFSTSSSNVMLLYGEPGTGKSGFIREMLRHRGFDARTVLADRDAVLDNDGLVDYVRDLPSGTVMIMEDADRLVGKRTEGNPTMSGLLNAANGLVPTDVKIIITTNLPNLKSVDEALIRPGRCFKVLQFKKLTVQQGQQAREALGLPSVDLGTGDLTLAEALNYEQRDDNIHRSHGPGFA